MLTLLTATGSRPVAWALCEQLMQRQTYAGNVRWIVVDDGEIPQPICFSRPGWQVDVIRPYPPWQAGQNTQSRNILAGLECVSNSDRLVIIEDDDYYSPGYLTHVSEHIQRAELVGESHARYYNVTTKRHHTHNNDAHASLCATALTGAAIQRLRELCQTPRRFIDLDLWRDHPSKSLANSRLTVGIKGLPGRAGIGIGHDRSFGRADDSQQTVLREWLGQDAGLYACCTA